MPVNFGILSWDEPTITQKPDPYGRVIVDGLVPVSLATKMHRRCADYNRLKPQAPAAEFNRVGWDYAPTRNMVRRADRILVEGLVPVDVAHALEKMCKAYDGRKAAA